MISEFKKFIYENRLVKPGDRVLLAVSGGIDSMVMSDLFLRSGFETGIAHCNFSLRGDESDKDEEMVLEYATENNIPFYTIRFDTKAYSKTNGISIEMAARDLRFKWFKKIQAENNYSSVAVAHNMNDNIETLLINLTRGTGLTGMSGMRPSHDGIIRPLLFATRQDIINYRDKYNIKFREDRSNAEIIFIRNKIRHQIIPVLKEINPSIETTLNDTAKRFTGINQIVSEYITGLRKAVSEQKGEITVFNINLLKKNTENKTVIFELFKPFGINNLQLNDLIKVIEGKTGGQISSASHRIIKNRKELIISVERNAGETTWTIKDITGFHKIPCIASAKYHSFSGNEKIPPDPCIAYIDSRKIAFPFVIRKWKAGDYFYPLGMNQKKKMSDYFIDKKYSVLDKENCLILESDGKIVWIIGDRIDNRFRITESTKKALIIKAKGRRQKAEGK
jgi:tRNA(Ile)-lysidine synthase